MFRYISVAKCSHGVDMSFQVTVEKGVKADGLHEVVSREFSCLKLNLRG